MGTFSVLLALCAGNSPVTGEFSSQRSVTQSFDVYFDLRQNTKLDKQSRRRWFETPSRSLWRNYNDLNNWGLMVNIMHTEIFKCIVLKEMLVFFINISAKFVLNDPIDNKSTMVQVKALAPTAGEAIRLNNADPVHWRI